MDFKRRRKKLCFNRVTRTILNEFAPENSSSSEGNSALLFHDIHSSLRTMGLTEDYELELPELLNLVQQLEKVVHPWKPNKVQLLRVFWGFHAKLHSISKKDFDHGENLDVAKNIRDMLFRHALQVLVRFVSSSSLLPLNSAEEVETAEMLELKGIALEILHSLCVEYDELSDMCANTHYFVQSLFSYMQFNQTCFPACKLLECLMLSQKSVFDLATVEKLPEIIMGMSDIHLGNFCKILTVTLSELDMYENKLSLFEQTKQNLNQNVFVRDMNQDAILRVPNILTRLVNIACAKPYVPCFPAGVIESEQWLRWIEEQFSMEIESGEEEHCDKFFGGLTQWSDTSTTGPIKTSIKMSLELTFRADAVCVLGLLLIGRHRKDVQKELAELKLIPQLSDLFDYFIWRTNIREYTRLPGHNSSCECSPEVALKIQVLRLIHSFCDHSDYKHVMLSWSEYSEIKALEETPDSETPSWLNRDVMCVGIRGLLSKIVEVIKKETGASTFRFWLSRAVESYLRGCCSSADQDFLLRRNLLQYVVQNLIQNPVRHKEVLQSNFDLLGELVKFNIGAFVEFNSHVYGSVKQKKLLALMNCCLVDSNMFIRSLILSYELFVSSGDVDLKVFAEECCHILSHVGSVKTRVYYLQKLLTLINVKNLTQENVSCLNTALVILMFGLKKGELPQYLHSLSAKLDGCSMATRRYVVYLENLRDLLLFWQDHYLQKDKDCTILEKSSRICFQEWRDTVSLLTSSDAANPCSIAHYTEQVLISRAS